MELDYSYAFEDEEDSSDDRLMKPSTSIVLALAIPGLVFALSKNFNWALWESFKSTKAVYVLIGVSLLIVYFAIRFASTLKSIAAFIHGCFLKKIDGETQIERLESFYASQADIYDKTRTRLLGGRVDMLRVVAGQLRDAVTQGRLAPMKDDLVWIDIGGGTGWNIEQMNSNFPVSQFKKVYLLDLCPSLCANAKKRFEHLGWENVEVICGDACDKTKPLPIPDGCAALVTFSYSLSMIPNFYAAVDLAKRLLHNDGFLGIVDFGVSDKTDPFYRRYGWFMRWFWQIWFEFDHVALHPSRRKYVEHCFDTIKDFTSKNKKMLGAPLPFYIFLGEKVPEERETLSQWRMKFDDSYKSPWNTYMYAYAWEDPTVDLQHMDIKETDNVLAITSGGCNILEYVLAGARNVWSVDMNPAQNDLLELKLAMLRSPLITYEEFWQVFGTGRCPHFSQILDLKVSPYLSAGAYRFWKKNAKTFEKKGLYTTGHSGLATKFAQFLISLFRIKDSVKEFSTTKSPERCFELWNTRVSPYLFPKWVISLILNRKKFMWEALGVPKKQMKLLLNEFDGNLEKCIWDTFEPVAKKGIMATENYFYYLPLMGEYSPDCCPSYLKPENFQMLRESKNLANVRINTAKYIDVLRKGGPNGQKFTKVVLMDHMDWFNAAQAEEQIDALWDAVAEGGKIYWRSAEKVPWYNSVFKRRGFWVNQLGVRHSGEFIDRVNMYLSFNVAVKPVKV